MFNVTSNDPRVEEVMQRFWAEFGTEVLVLMNEDYLSFKYDGTDGWHIECVVKHPYTFVTVTYQGRIAHAFGKVNWEDTFCARDGFEIVSRKALAEWHRGNVMSATAGSTHTHAKYGVGQELISVNGGGVQVIESKVVDALGSVFYKFAGFSAYSTEGHVCKHYNAVTSTDNG